RHIRRSDPQATTAAHVGGPLIAAVEHDLRKGWWPAEKQPPAALGARPLLDAVFQCSRPRHLVWGGQANSDLRRALLLPSFPRLPARTPQTVLARPRRAVPPKKPTDGDVSGTQPCPSALVATRDPGNAPVICAGRPRSGPATGGNHGFNATPVRFTPDHGYRH